MVAGPAAAQTPARAPTIEPRAQTSSYASLPKFQEEKPPADLRALLEISAALGLATVWYIVDDRNVFDFDFPAIEERFSGEAWRFDNNTFGINYLAHPLNGAGMYVLARGNRVRVWPAFGYTLLGSTFWEYVIEFQEKVSINDVIVTPLLGLAFGEFFHKLAWYVSSSPSGSGRGLAWSLGLSVHGHRVWDGRKAPKTDVPDSLGLASEMGHRFSADYGFGLVEQDPSASQDLSALHRVEFDGELVSLPGYLGPRRVRGWFYEAQFARLRLGIEAGRGGIGYDFFSEVLAIGYHLQNEVLASTSGISVGYQLRNTDVGGYDDRQGLLFFPGLVSDLRAGPRALRPRGWEPHALSSHLRLSAYPSFGSLSALAYPAWQEQNPDARAKTILARGGYSYSLGLTLVAESELGFGPLHLRGRAWLGEHDSIQGLDRSQELVSDDSPLHEHVAELSVGAWLRPPDVPLDFGLSYEWRSRTSSMGLGSRSTSTHVESSRMLMRVGSTF